MRACNDPLCTQCGYTPDLSPLPPPEGLELRAFRNGVAIGFAFGGGVALLVLVILDLLRG